MAEAFAWNYCNSQAWMRRVTDLPPLIITVAVNGGIQGKESHPALPETPAEIAAAAGEGYDAGAAIVHIHGRKPHNLAECTDDPAVYREINSLVRQRCADIIINNTSGGGPNLTMADRFRCLEARPEMASLNMGADMSRFRIPERPAPLMHPHPAAEHDICVPFTYGIIEGLAEAMLARGIKPEMEMYHPGQYWVVQQLLHKNLMPKPYWFQFVMGYQTSSYPTPWHLLELVRELPAGALFSTIGIGRYQWAMITMSILLGGHVRVGLEDNLYLARGRKLQGNGEAVERVVRIARELNREIATPAQARAMLGLAATPSAG